MRTCATEDTFSSEGVAIEKMVRNATDVVGRDNRVCAGCICFLIHCRARCGDANYVTEEPTLNLCDGHGDIEASTRRAKVLDGFTKQGRAPPLVGHSLGLSGVPWAYEWLRLRKDAGLDANRTRCLLPRPHQSSGCTEVRLPTSGSATWLQKIIAQLQFSADLQLRGTHSCKTTLLSWAEKASLKHGIRRVLFEQRGRCRAYEATRCCSSPSPNMRI